jgi:hypothetical protein
MKKRSFDLGDLFMSLAIILLVAGLLFAAFDWNGLLSAFLVVVGIAYLISGAFLILRRCGR